MARKAREEVREKVRQKRAAKALEINAAEEQILQKATIHLITKHGGLFVATDLREEAAGDGVRRWVIAVTLRYPTGFEGYVGDLLYNGKEFTFLTPQEVIDQRVAEIAADPEGRREWDEYRGSTLPPGET